MPLLNFFLCSRHPPAKLLPSKWTLMAMLWCTLMVHAPKMVLMPLKLVLVSGLMTDIHCKFEIYKRCKCNYFLSSSVHTLIFCLLYRLTEMYLKVSRGVSQTTLLRLKLQQLLYKLLLMLVSIKKKNV